MVPPVKTAKDPLALARARDLTNVPWCEDYERMVSGMLYTCYAPELVAARHRARRIAQRFNTYIPTEDLSADDTADVRMGMIRELFGRVGEGSYLEPSLQVDYGCNITVGSHFYANFNCVILDCAHVTIGDRVLFATGVSLITATHETGVQSRRDMVEYAEPIEIGDDCWLGANVTVLPGVKIGKGCTIGAGAVVSRDVPDFSVAVGVPARVVKKVDPVD
ncbi:maltose O-acetyltransferase [Microdochium nivale]|nr:maltose O-acetyltransferase [Microdochium nivale]